MEPEGSGVAGKELQLPAPFNDRSLEQYEHAPTLIAGETAGTQGVVRVWAPGRQPFLMLLLGAVVVTAWAIFDTATTRNGLGLMLTLCYATAFMAWCMTVPHRYYFTTDDAGIGITTRTGSRALRWGEIISCGRGNPADPNTYRLLLQGGEVVEIHLTGHSKGAEKELIALIEGKVRPPVVQPSLAPQLKAGGARRNHDKQFGGGG